MNIFEKAFGGPKDVMEELEQKEVEAVELEPAKEPKTLTQVKEAIGEIQTLKSERYNALEKHRDTVQELRNLGVNEYSPDDAPRTETVNDILNPIEQELAAISKEITEKREEFDLQPKREEVINNRLFRLGQIESRLQDEFYKTPSGNTLKVLDNEISRWNNKGDGTSPNTIREEVNKLQEKRSAVLRDDQVANIFRSNSERITRMKVDLEDTLSKVKDSEYDENGQQRVGSKNYF